MNDGQPLPAQLHQLVCDLFNDSVARLVDFEFGFMPLLPEEEEPLSQRVEALSLGPKAFDWHGNYSAETESSLGRSA